MDNETFEWINSGNKPVFESDYSFFSAITFLTIGAVTVVLFSVYLMVCILRIKVNNGNNHIKQILYLTIIDTTVGIACICRAIFAVVCPAKQTFEICAALSIGSFLWDIGKQCKSDQTPQHAASDQFFHCLLTEVSFKISKKK